jgi:hypothetical protein
MKYFSEIIAKKQKGITVNGCEKMKVINHCLLLGVLTLIPPELQLTYDQINHIFNTHLIKRTPKKLFSVPFGVFVVPPIF